MLTQNASLLIAENITPLRLSSRGVYAFCTLERSGISSRDAAQETAKKLRIIPEKIRLILREDAGTSGLQWISIESKNARDLDGARFKLRLKGFLNEPLEKKLIAGYRYSVSLQGLDSGTAQLCEDRLRRAGSHGSMNYFGRKYLAPHDPLQGFLAEKILKEHFNGAAKIYLTGSRPEDDEAARARKKKFFDHWKDWKKCLELAETKTEKTQFHYLVRNPDHFLGFLHEIPKEELEEHFLAFQAFLWNETARRLLCEIAGLEPLRTVRTASQELVFYDRLSDESVQKLLGTKIPTLSAKTLEGGGASRKASTAVLAEHGIDKNLFNRLKFRKVYFRSEDRPAAVTPKILECEKQFSAGKTDLRLVFELPGNADGRTLTDDLVSPRDSRG